MVQFASCWEGLEDPRTGNAALHGSVWRPERGEHGRVGEGEGGIPARLPEAYCKHGIPSGSLRGKFKRAGWNDAYLTSLLALF